MQMKFTVTDANKYTELTDRLESNDIKYTVIDRDNCVVGFKVANNDVEDFQQRMAGDIIGSAVPGYFEFDE